MERFQTSNFTTPMRYRAAYSDLARILTFTAEPKVLLFGCSTGIELLNVLAIKPHAQIVATDIDQGSLEIAETAFQGLKNVRFCLSDWRIIQAHRPFDVIIANSVFCDHPAATGLTKFEAFPFSHFEAAVENFLAMMHKLSVLMMQNFNYSLQDSALARELAPCNTEISGFVPKFSKSGDQIVHVVLRSGMPVFYRRPDIAHEDIVNRLKGTLFSLSGSQLRRPLERQQNVQTFSVQQLTGAPNEHDGWPIVPYTYTLWRGGNQLYDYSFID